MIQWSQPFGSIQMPACNSLRDLLSKPRSRVLSGPTAQADRVIAAIRPSTEILRRIICPSPHAQDFDPTVPGHAARRRVVRQRAAFAEAPDRVDPRPDLPGDPRHRVGAPFAQREVRPFGGAGIGVALDDEAIGRMRGKEALQPGGAGGRDPRAAGGEHRVGGDHGTTADLMADRGAVAAQMRTHVAFDTVIHDPVFAPVRIDPDARNILFALLGHGNLWRRQGEPYDPGRDPRLHCHIPRYHDARYHHGWWG